jgi:sugar transferase (PEP-CTERM/EpsH1 system associated)
VSHRDFEMQIKTLARYYSAVGLSQALRALDDATSSPRPLAVVTFDDGYRTTVRRAAPVLRAYGVPATAFLPCGLLAADRPQWHDRIRRTIGAIDRPEIRIVLQGVTRMIRIPVEEAERRLFIYRLTEWLKTLDSETREEALRQIETQAPACCAPDQDEYLMDWDDVQVAAECGLEFGSHTVSHAVLPTEDAARARWEIEESKRVLESRLGHPVSAFCYPNGAYTPAIREMVRQAGYECALTVEPGLNEGRSDRYTLRRFTMTAAEGPYTLLARLSGFEAWLKRAVRFVPRVWQPVTPQPEGPWEWNRVAFPSRGARAPAVRVRGGDDQTMSVNAPPARRKIRLMHVVHTLMVGGMERLVVDLVEGLSPDLYDRYVCCLDQRGPLADELQGRGVTVYCLNKGSGVRWDLPWKVRRLIRRLGIGVVHTHNLSGLLYGGVGATLAGVKVIVHTEHGRDLDYYQSRRSQRLERVLTRLANRVVSVSRPIFDELRHVQGIPLSRLLLIGNGVRIERYPAAPAPDLRARLGIAERDRVIGIVARLVPVKDHSTMLRAMVAVIRAIPEARLVVVGGGPLRGELEAQAARLGIASRVTFLGSRLDVADLLGLMEIFALSSVSEGMSMTILEAMAARCPVVATDVGGTSWLVHHEKTGLLVPSQQPDRLADAIVRLLNDRVWAAQLGQAGYELVRERFQLDQVIQQYDDLYRQLLGAR